MIRRMSKTGWFNNNIGWFNNNKGRVLKFDIKCYKIKDTKKPRNKEETIIHAKY